MLRRYHKQACYVHLRQGHHIDEVSQAGTLLSSQSNLYLDQNRGQDFVLGEN